MTTPVTLTLEIEQFCNCKGCIKKLRKTLDKIGDVRLLATDPSNGKFTILSTKHPQVIEYALNTGPFPNKNINVSQEIDHSDQSQSPSPSPSPSPPSSPRTYMIKSYAPPVPMPPYPTYWYPPGLYGYENYHRG